MNGSQFDTLLKDTRLGQSKLGRETNRAVIALRRHLVDGVPMGEACDEQDVSRSAVYMAKSRLLKGICPHCGQALPKNGRAKK